MSRLWDTPEFWIRREADEVLRDCPKLTAEALASRFERSRRQCYEDPQFVRDLIDELRKRANARVRFWPDSASALQRANAAATEAGTPYLASTDSLKAGDLELADGSNYWWQRM